MRIRRSVVLPLAQVGVVVGWWVSWGVVPSYKWPLWHTIGWQFLMGVNAPACQLRSYLGRLVFTWSHWYTPYVLIVDTLVYFLLIWALWYAVSIELEGNGRCILASKTRARGLADGCAAIYGAVLAVSAFRIHRQDSGYLVSLPDHIGWPDLVAALYLLWGILIATFCICDLRALFAERTAAKRR